MMARGHRYMLVRRTMSKVPLAVLVTSPVDLVGFVACLGEIIQRREMTAKAEPALRTIAPPKRRE